MRMARIHSLQGYLQSYSDPCGSVMPLRTFLDSGSVKL